MANCRIVYQPHPAAVVEQARSFKSVGQSHPTIDAREKVMGRLEYVTDMEVANMLHGKILRSPHPHARILDIDTQRARRLPGVKAVITSDHTPRLLYGPMIADQYPLAVDRVRYVGDAVAAVAAADLDTATEALQLIDVEYEPLSPVFDPEEAMRAGAPLLHDEKANNVATFAEWEHGNVTDAFRQSDLILEERFSTQLVHQCYLEPMAAIAAWDAQDRLTMWLPIQVPAVAQGHYAKALDLPPGRVHIVQAHMGGAFGAKLEHSFHLVCALLAKAAGRPVRIMYTREEEFEAGLPRVPFIIDLKVGVKRDGALMAKQARLIADNGAYTSYGPAILSAAATRSDCLYRLNNVRTSMTLVYTNKIPTGCFRGFGNLQMHFANESMMDMLADGLGLDPVDFRLRNATQTGDVTVHGFRIGSCGLSECLERAAERASWRAKRARKKRLRGIGVAAAIHVSGNRSFVPEFDGSAAIVRIDGNGKAIVLTGEVDMGQGAKTAFAQIAAEVLGLPIGDVSVPNVDTDLSPFGLGSWASRTTTLGGNAVKAAAEDARETLLITAGEMLGARPEALSAEEGCVLGPGGSRLPIAEVARHHLHQNGGAPIVGQGHFIPPGVEVSDAKTKFGNVSCAYPFGVHVAEVEVDADTGLVSVLNVVAAHDVGKLLNPMIAEGQVEGGVAQGMGFALTEQMQVASGKTVNPGFQDYKIPSTLDMPEIACIFVESQDPHGPYGAKGLAEPAIIPLAPAIANALFDALKVRFTHLPISPEKVLLALQNRETQGPSNGGQVSAPG